MDHVPLVYVCVPRNQARSFIQQGMPNAMVSLHNIPELRSNISHIIMAKVKPASTDGRQFRY